MSYHTRCALFAWRVALLELANVAEVEERELGSNNIKNNDSLVYIRRCTRNCPCTFVHAVAVAVAAVPEIHDLHVHGKSSVRSVFFDCRLFFDCHCSSLSFLSVVFFAACLRLLQ